ncbi:hypothetical protein A4X06_0g9829 [Tilletia controversa]|uniref:Uncharacterized protein n=1 Tax=Tilletia controversa TaxID=13291 RepID=A0A8X7SRT9_9BASI|nr:hypothetical protein CF328_g9511 [Tilletia controversa]KAE8235565.1 hypothetical protein A4X06_0g9829 [Tilletia controversa]
MQIRRFSPLSFFLPAVLIGSIALGMVAGAPAPASADLEQHTAESFLKRTLPNLEKLSLEDLQELLKDQNKALERYHEATNNMKSFEGTTEERKQVAIDRLTKQAGGVQANIDTIRNSMKSWGEDLRLGRS